MDPRTRQRIVCALVSATGVAVVGVSLYDAVLRDPHEAGARALAAACWLGGATLAYAGAAAYLAIGRRPPRALSALLVGAYSVVAAFSAGELATSLMDRSHSVGYALAAKVWFARHWRLNPYGYRDAPWTPAELQYRKVIAVIGDSLTTGHGIADPADTYCARLGVRLGPSYRVLNLGVNAADTRTETMRLQQLPLKPHAVVLEYYGNDILEGARDAGFVPPRWSPFEHLPMAFRTPIEWSYLVNYLYFSLPRSDTEAHWAFIRGLYQRPDVRARHGDELRNFAAQARALGVPLVVVLFPYLHDLPGSEIYVPFVRDIFNAEGVPVLDVRPLVEKMPLAERIVNMNDVHPSVEVHRLVGDALHFLMVDRGIVR